MSLASPFAALPVALPLRAIRAYVVLMALAVLAGVLFDIFEKGNARFFLEHRRQVGQRARRHPDAGMRAWLALKTAAEAAVSGEFCYAPRRASHLLMMYGFLLYVVTTVLLVFVWPIAAPPLLVPLWTLGAVLMFLGSLWFFLFLRVNVAYDGAGRLHVGRADLFVLGLLASGLTALLWQFAGPHCGAAARFWWLMLYLLATALLFGTVAWSKFAHMFYKPVVAYQRRLEDASGASDLPAPVSHPAARNP